LILTRRSLSTRFCCQSAFSTLLWQIGLTAWELQNVFLSQAKFSFRKRNFRFVSGVDFDERTSLRKVWPRESMLSCESERGVGGSGAEIVSIRRPGFCAKKTIGEFHRSRRSGRRSRVIRSASSRRQFSMRA
jgi:hypothetical protein